MKNNWILILSILVGALACRSSFPVVDEPPVVVDITPKRDSMIRILALGDSYTIGQSVDSTMRFPAQLRDSLLKDSFSMSALQVIAKTGWRTDNLANAINAANPDSNWNIVTLLIGVNNQYQGYDVSTYEQPFRQLLQRAIAFAKGDTSRVFVVSIPDYAYTPFGQNANDIAALSAEIDAYNAVNEQVAAAFGVHYINITPISRQGIIEPTLVANDGLHPSGKMYQRWVSLMLPAVKARLEN